MSDLAQDALALMESLRNLAEARGQPVSIEVWPDGHITSRDMSADEEG